MSISRTIKRRLSRDCAVCGKRAHIILYTDRHYRGGHYFGKIPLHRFDRKGKAVKPYRYAEYWECPKCYWGN